MQTYHATVAMRDDAILAEGPMWHSVHKILYWVDIHKRLIHALEPHSNLHRQWDTGKMTSALTPSLDGDLITAMEGGLGSFNPEQETLKQIASLEHAAQGYRCNDGKIDPHGRIWVRTIPNQSTAHCTALISHSK